MDLKKTTKAELAETLRRTKQLLADTESHLLKVKREVKALQGQVEQLSDEKVAAKKALREIVIATTTIMEVKFPGKFERHRPAEDIIDIRDEGLNALIHLNRLAQDGLSRVSNARRPQSF